MVQGGEARIRIVSTTLLLWSIYVPMFAALVWVMAREDRA